MVPLAQAAAAAGHDVAFATAERFCRRVIEPAGFLAFPAGLSPLVVEDQTNHLPEVATLDPDDVWAFGAHMFAQVAAPAKVGDLVRILEDWHPQLVVHDCIDFAAPIASSRVGVPWASHSFGALQPEEFWSLSAQLVEPTWRSWDLEPPPAGGMFQYLYLDICPPSFQAWHAGRVPVRHRMRPVPFDTPGGEGLPAWFSSLPHRPNVYVTMGTIFNDTPGVFEAVLAGLGDGPFNVIVTIGLDRDPDELGPQPPNVRIERWIPQSLIFEACEVAVCHGGSGTTLAALSHGLPLLLLPQGANQLWNAERCVSLGAGRMLRPDGVDGAAIRQEVDRLLLIPSFRLAALGLRREIELMPVPAQIVPLLEALARDSAPLLSDPHSAQ
ncbi:MAG: DUF1205 domain-containing protein [Actinomycetota bacterium]|nr:DUF1205 domain-containing protein [Actinomycetota bacterium]